MRESPVTQGRDPETPLPRIAADNIASAATAAA
jgi:hypothetical protein